MLWNFFNMKNSWNCYGFPLNSFWQFRFDEKNYELFCGKIRESVARKKDFRLVITWSLSEMLISLTCSLTSLMTAWASSFQPWESARKISSLFEVAMFKILKERRGKLRENEGIMSAALDYINRWYTGCPNKFKKIRFCQKKKKNFVKLKGVLHCLGGM